MDLEVPHSYIKNYQEIRISSSQFPKNYNSGSYTQLIRITHLFFSSENEKYENVQKNYLDINLT